mmetsp:Transcript_22293/g.51011  ORF Transcript_22293/g.51011 Transcript_22293/m.51011 type:complete len:224 (-) Transcript_22293:2597-3268(-)
MQVFAVGRWSMSAVLLAMMNFNACKPMMGTRSQPVQKRSNFLFIASDIPCTACQKRRTGSLSAEYPFPYWQLLSSSLKSPTSGLPHSNNSISSAEHREKAWPKFIHLLAILTKLSTCDLANAMMAASAYAFTKLSTSTGLSASSRVAPSFSSARTRLRSTSPSMPGTFTTQERPRVETICACPCKSVNERCNVGCTADRSSNPSFMAGWTNNLYTIGCTRRSK